MRKMPPLNAIRAFEAVARNRSFSAAARELAVTATAISHQIRNLEALVGVRLIERNPRHVALTPAGERAFPLLREGMDRLADAFGDIYEKRDGTSIAVTTTRAFAERWLMPRLARFRAAHPSVLVHVDAGETLADLRTSGMDVAIRYGRSFEDGLSGFTLFEDRFVAVAVRPPGSRGKSLKIADFARRELLAFRWKNPALCGPTWEDWFAAGNIPGRDRYRVSWHSEEHLALQALDHGHGPLLASDVLVASALESGTCARIDGPLLRGLTFSVLQAPATARQRAGKAFCDWLRIEAAATSRVT